MVQHGKDVQPMEFLSHLRDHVLTPIETGLECIANERKIVEDERQSFASFANSVQTVETNDPVDATATLPVHQPATGTADVRAAYQRTVMDATGREEEADQSLRELAAEFGDDVAAQLAPDSSTVLTDHLQQVIVSAADRSRFKRTSLLDEIDREREELTAGRQTLTELTASLDSSQVPSWYRSTVNEQLETLTDRRQESLSKQCASLRRDGHELCEYLYSDEPWTYPVLTAVTRVRRSMSLSV